MSAARDQIIEATCELLEAQGYHATGLNQIIKESGSPKGSLYYYFPEGKEELVEEAIDRTGAAVVARIAHSLAGADPPSVAVGRFVGFVADQVELSGFRSGGPLTTVAMETATTSARLNAACRAAYRKLEGAFAARLAEAGYAAPRAAELGQFITASIEGGIILSRTYHTGDPLRRVAAELERALAAEQPRAA
jgi:TetR/AcrR family transcriptional repressor of lmrAB and yxaGH operons